MLKDSVQIERNKAKNQFALIRYETEKNKIENEKLKTEKAEKENKILRQNFLLLLLSIGIVAFYFWYKRRKKLLQLEKENEIRNTELRYSKKVHDVVANGLYQTMVEIQNKEKIEKEFIEDEQFESPLNVYGYSKLLFDQYLRRLMPTINSQVVGLRYFNIFNTH